MSELLRNTTGFLFDFWKTRFLLERRDYLSCTDTMNRVSIS